MLFCRVRYIVAYTMSFRVLKSFGIVSFLCLSVSLLVSETNDLEPIQPNDSKALVYVIPISEEINQPNLYILRRGLKEAIRKKADMVLLDMDTPGGRLDICLEMMEMLGYFEGKTATYVNPDAISAGAFIASASDQIFFSPKGKMGAAGVIQGTGEDVPETARMKIESYLLANIRIVSEEYPYRSEVIRAMLDPDYELVIEEQVLKPKGELLTVTASQAMEVYGDAGEPLLGAGIFESIELLLEEQYGRNGYILESFEMTYSEEFAKWMSTIAPLLLGLGLLALFIEFKTPGFGLFGIAGIVLLGVFFLSNYIAGLAGNEAIVLFGLGLGFLAIEIFVLPGLFIFGLLGLGMVVWALIYAMSDFWPGGTVPFSFEILLIPTQNLLIGLFIAIVGALLIGRFLKGSFIERALVLSETLRDKSSLKETESLMNSALVGKKGTSLTRLNPAGIIQIEGQRFEAHANIGYIDEGREVVVSSRDQFKINVDLVSEDS